MNENYTAHLGEAFRLVAEPGNGTRYDLAIYPAAPSFGGKFVIWHYIGWIGWWDGHSASSLRTYGGKLGKVDKAAIMTLLEKHNPPHPTPKHEATHETL